MEEIYRRLKASTPKPYAIEWNANPATPIRYRIDAPKERVEVYNFLWSEAITKVTGALSFEKENFTRFTVPYQQTNISISIFPTTGTIMLQSNSSPFWADQYMHQICEYVKKDEKGYLTPATCVVCNKDGNNDMVVCDHEYCQSWTHNDCAGLTEQIARSSVFWCKICTDEFVEKQYESSQDVSPILEDKTSTPNQNKNNVTINSVTDSDISSILNLSKNQHPNEIMKDDTSLSIVLDSSKSQSSSTQDESIKGTVSPFKNMESLLLDLSKGKTEKQYAPSETSPDSSQESSQSMPYCPNTQIPNYETVPQIPSKETEPNISKLEDFSQAEKSKPELYINSSDETRENNHKSGFQRDVELEIKNSELESSQDRIKYLEELLELRGSPQQTKHRLEHRNVSAIIKEFTTLEDRFKILQKQLNHEIESKKQYKNELLISNQEKENALENIKSLSQQLNNPLKNCQQCNDKDNLYHIILQEKEDAQKEIRALKEQEANEISNKDNIIQNHQNQIEMDEEIKRNLNDCLEQAFAEIKDLNEIIEKQKRPTKNKSTMTNENLSLPKRPDNKETSGPVDLTLPTRSRANPDKTNHPNLPTRANPDKTNHENAHDPLQPLDTLPNPPVGLNLDRNQMNYLNNYRNSKLNLVRNPNYIEKNHSNQQPNINLVVENPQNHQTEQIQQQHGAPNEKQNEYILRPTESMNPHITLDSRFTVHRFRRKSSRNQKNDNYDFALRDNPKERTKGRPICKWYLKDKCHSDVCVYRHPNKDSANNDETISLDDISDTELRTNAPQEICRYYLQNRCWFGHSCKNLHPNLDNVY